MGWPYKLSHFSCLLMFPLIPMSLAQLKMNPLSCSCRHSIIVSYTLKRWQKGENGKGVKMEIRDEKEEEEGDVEVREGKKLYRGSQKKTRDLHRGHIPHFYLYLPQNAEPRQATPSPEPTRLQPKVRIGQFFSTYNTYRSGNVLIPGWGGWLQTKQDPPHPKAHQMRTISLSLMACQGAITDYHVGTTQLRFTWS